MTSKELIENLRKLADSMEAHHPDFNLRHRVTACLIAWDVNLEDSTSSLNVWSDLTKLLDAAYVEKM